MNRGNEKRTEYNRVGEALSPMKNQPTSRMIRPRLFLQFSGRPRRWVMSAVVMLGLWLAWLPVAAEAAVASTSVDFGRQALTVWGLGGLPWEDEGFTYEEERNRAWMDALHHAYDELLELPFMEGLEVRQVLHQYPSLRGKLRQTLLAAPKTFFEADLSRLIRCKVSVPFTGPSGLRAALFLAALGPRGIEPRSFFPMNATPTKELLATGTTVTRAIIDLRETAFEPSLFPRFFDDEGKLLFQEARIPGPERFSRPVVRFTEEIAEVEKDRREDEIAYAAARLHPLATRDIVIRSPDDEWFRRLCRRLEADPRWAGEILVVHGRRVMPPGVYVKPAAKETDKTAKPKGKAGQAKPRAR